MKKVETKVFRQIRVKESFLSKLDKIANNKGITRTSLVMLWLTEKIDEEAKK